MYQKLRCLKLKRGYKMKSKVKRIGNRIYYDSKLVKILPEPSVLWPDEKKGPYIVSERTKKLLDEAIERVNKGKETL